MALDALPSAADKRAAVRGMFDRIAPRYDRLNRLISAGLDQRWRQAAMDAVSIDASDRVVDLACGTGDLAELAAQRGATVIAVDYAREMLRGAQQRGIRARLVEADCAALPLPDAYGTAVTCGFALRNFASLPAVLGEMARILVPGGRLVVLEVDRPKNPILRAGHSVYFNRVVPILGGLLSDRAAYTYLPQSASYLPNARELEAMLIDAGFERIERRALAWGAIQLDTAVRRSAN